MDAQQIKAFIDAMAASDLAELEAEKDGWRLRLVRWPATAAIADETLRTSPSAVGNATSPVRHEQRAAMCGVVFLQPSPGAAPYAVPGQSVRAGQVLCMLEAMKIFNEVQAERDGIVDEVLVASGQEVDAGQVLLRLR